MVANDMKLRFPNQLFINNEFVDASDSKTFDTVNPTDESVSVPAGLCLLASCTPPLLAGHLRCGQGQS